MRDLLSPTVAAWVVEGASALCLDSQNPTCLGSLAGYAQRRVVFHRGLVCDYCPLLFSSPISLA
ncbi:hypothetical protein CYB_0634 [Synechococcus sp. JA-2-3B'a(2-13)]|nr:hypothetical protein CYB_0634 [Synechococcus sp. JA-2-3B'a(2-13)]